jgi:hypothetical protein
MQRVKSIFYPDISEFGLKSRKGKLMKFILVLFLFTSMGLKADGPIGENVSGHYGGEEMFTLEGQGPIPPKGYDKKRCFQATKTFRAQINRLRTASYRIDRRCEKGKGDARVKECLTDIAYGKMILGLLNRTYEVITNVCANN